MNSTIYVFKEFKEDVLDYIKDNEEFIHSGLPVPDGEWLGKTISIPFYTKSGKLIKNKKYVCIISSGGYRWVEVDPKLGKPDLVMTYMDNSNKINIPKNHIGVVIDECIVEDEIVIEGELLITSDIQEGDIQPQ